MRTTPSRLTLLALASLSCSLAAPARAQIGPSCPNQRASLVPAASGVVPPWRTCFLQVPVLGVVISLPNGRCPTGRTFVAAHQECLGMYGAHMLCQEAGLVAIELQRCRCVPHTGPHYSYSTCECHAAGALGFVSAGQTAECP